MLRVLYRVQFLSQNKPFDPITFMLLYPLLAKVITAGGLDVPAEERDLALEQVSLAMDAIVAHCHSGEGHLKPLLSRLICNDSDSFSSIFP